MVTALAVALGIALGALVICAIEVWGLPRRRRRVHIALLKDGDNGGAIVGVLWARRGRWLVLKDAVYIDGGTTVESRLDGEVLLDRARVDFVQVQ